MSNLDQEKLRITQFQHLYDESSFKQTNTIIESMSSDEDLPEENHYSLKGSTKLVGQLYPVLKSKDGEILDGFHRSEANGSWRSETLENIDSEEKKLAARLIANFHRRKVPREEKAEWINNLAALYKEQGLRVESESNGSPGQGSNEIVNRICEVTGISKRTVHSYLSDDFKQMNYSRSVEQHRAEAPASEVIKNIISQRAWQNSGYADRLLERYQKELLESPIFRARVLSMLPGNHNTGSGIQIQDEQLPPDVYRGKDGFLHKRDKSKSKASENKIVIDPDAYYKVFIEECPDCICSKCPHGDTCIERVRAGE